MHVAVVFFLFAFVLLFVFLLFALKWLAIHPPLIRFLRNILDYGLCLIKGVPNSKGSVRKVRTFVVTEKYLSVMR